MILETMRHDLLFFQSRCVSRSSRPPAVTSRLRTTRSSTSRTISAPGSSTSSRVSHIGRIQGGGEGGRGLVHSAHLSFSCSFSAKILPNNRFFEPNSRVDASYLKILDSPQFIVNTFERVWRQSWGTIQEGGAGPEPCMGGWKGAGNRQTRLKALPLPLRWRSVKIGGSQKFREHSMVQKPVTW